VGEQPEQPGLGASGHGRILIAEDDALVAQDLKDRLETLEYRVPWTTQSAQEAVVLAQHLRPDLVLMDIQLPGDMDGIQAAKQIRTLHVPVFYVSGYCEGPVLERAKASEPYGYILKPYETRDLRIAIEIGLHRFRAEQTREPLNETLQAAMAKSKALAGMLSICCYCKKVKEQAGYWAEIEAYIMKRCDVSFTHGMCPECFERVKKQIEALDEGGAGSNSIVLG
jgi:two-component system, response regulator PdtaR